MCFHFRIPTARLIAQRSNSVPLALRWQTAPNGAHGKQQPEKANVETQTSPVQKRSFLAVAGAPDYSPSEDPARGALLQGFEPHRHHQQPHIPTRAERLSTHENNVLLDPEVLCDASSQALVLTILVSSGLVEVASPPCRGGGIPFW